MSRPKRIDLPFSLYHVFSRTNTGEDAFPDARDKERFLEYLAEYVDLFHFRIHVFCIMRNHFHLLLESTDHPQLSELMRRLLTAYTIYFNRRHGRHGHLFQGRFKSLIVDKSEYFLALSRYIHLNPSHTIPPHDPFTFDGSSLHYYLKGMEPEFLYTKEILSWFHGNRMKYGTFVREGLKEKTKLDIYQQRFIGGQTFARRIYKRLQHEEEPGTRGQKARRKLEEQIRESEELKAEEIIKKVTEEFSLFPDIIRKGRQAKGEVGKARAIVIALLRFHLPWSGSKIAEYLGLHREIYHYIRKVADDKELHKIYEKLKCKW